MKLDRDEIIRRLIKYLIHFLIVVFTSSQTTNIYAIGVIAACTFVLLDIYIPFAYIPNKTT